MEYFNPASHPPPDIIHLPSLPPPTDPQCITRIPQTPALPAPLPRNAALSFLIIGLFALRLTQRMLASLPSYIHRATDLAWLTSFLSPYDPAYDLARISGRTRADFLDTYPRILSRMKRQDMFPVRFMGTNPTVALRRDRGRGERSNGEWISAEGALRTGLTVSGAERKEIVDFVDTAMEWGSVVHIPRDEAEGISKMAEQRLVADLEAGRGGVGVRKRREDEVMAGDESRQTVLQDRHILLDDDYNIRRR